MTLSLKDIFQQKPDAETPEEFWRRTAEKRGAEIKYFSFAIYLGRSKQTVRDQPGLLYLAGDTLWFEDFEKDAGILSVFSSKTPYVKTEFGISKADIGSAKIIGKKTAVACIRGWTEPASAPVITRLGRIFSRSVVQIGVTKGASHYFEAMKEGELIGLLS
jgi:hypothetical protein